MEYKPVVFTDDLLTGNAEIDEQHKSLFSQMDKILDSIITGISQEEIYNLIDFLEAYTASHFQMEEALMEKHGYKETLYHQGQHERFVKDFKNHKETLKLSKPDLKQISSILSGLQNWLINHVMGEDKILAGVIRGDVSPD